MPIGLRPSHWRAWFTDADGDGLLDAVTLGGPPSRPVVMRGHGDGTFDDGVPVGLPPPLADNASLQAQGDFDGDGDLEWIVQATTLSFPDAVQLFVLDGPLTDVAAIPLPFLESPQDGWSHTLTAYAELNGDGATDPVITVKSPFADARWSILLSTP